MTLYRFVRTTRSEVLVEAESLDAAWEWLDDHDDQFTIFDEYDEVQS